MESGPARSRVYEGSRDQRFYGREPENAPYLGRRRINRLKRAGLGVLGPSPACQKECPPDEHPGDPKSRTKRVWAASIVAGAAQPSDRLREAESDMRHPDQVWADPGDADLPLEELCEAYRSHLEGRSKPASPTTIRKYMETIDSFAKSLALHSEPLVLASLTPYAVERWVTDQRRGVLPNRHKGKRGMQSVPCKDDTIASRHAALRAFARSFVFKHLQLTTRDLLDRSGRFDVKPTPKAGFTAAQVEKVLACWDRDTFEDIRDKALIAVFLASGLRFVEVLWLPIDALNRLTGDLHAVGKGSRPRHVRIGERALSLVRAYLRHRPPSEVVELFVTSRGKRISYDGGQSIFRRLKKRSGVAIAHAHRFRHTWAQTALRKGAERALVQDALGHESDAMTRRYSGWVRLETAAAAMPKFAPI